MRLSIWKANGDTLAEEELSNTLMMPYKYTVLGAVVRYAENMVIVGGLSEMTKKEILKVIANESEFKAWQYMLSKYRKSVFEDALKIYEKMSRTQAKKHLKLAYKYKENCY